MELDKLAGLILVAYVAGVAGYVGWRLAMRTVRRESAEAGMREQLWQLNQDLVKVRQQLARAGVQAEAPAGT